jgi:hypothetical protein
MAWLTCLLEFNSGHRQAMAPNRYIELFFLDEATAFAAGHRLCFECRRPDITALKLPGSKVTWNTALTKKPLFRN